MSDARFAPGAVRLAGLAARLLGWRPAEFWAATPAELACVLAPPAADGSPLSRSDLNRMMERENDRPG
ncbi:phage tail assembly chaperone [Novosphingobium sp.]|mgnify:CR=1 FL=1|uniref:phage tail assembly chaperone n=1 Tax=Novosphingobium sp. TaxID=1874826 RepID=UPI0035B33B3F